MAQLKEENFNPSGGKFSKQSMVCDFNGQHLRIAVTPQPPLVNCFQNYFGEWMCNGSNIEIINVLEERLNFQADWLVLSNNHLDKSLPLVKKSDQLFSSTANLNSSSSHRLNSSNLAKGTALNYSGVLNLVASGRAWLSANGVISTPERERNLLLSEPFDSFRLHFLLSKSVRDHDHIFIKPFNPNAWFGIFVAAFAIIPIFYLINTTSSHYPLINDKFLQQISVQQCFQYYITSARQTDFIKSIKNRALIFDRGSISSSSFSSSSDDKIYNTLSETIGVLELERSNRRIAKYEARKRRQLLLERKRQIKQVIRNSRYRFGFFKLAYIVWYIVGSLAAQGGETEDLPHASSTRILVAFWWLYLIVISSIHSGVLTAILTFPKQNDFIQTLDDFLELNEGKEKMKLAVDKHSELAYVLSNRDNLHKSPMQDLFKQGQKEQELKNTIIEVDFQRYRQRVLDDVLRGKSAYLEEKSTINMIISQEYFDHKPPKCQFKSSRFAIDTIPMSFVLSPQLTNACILQINALLRFIMRTGLAQKWRRKYEVLGNDCLETVIINAGDVDKIEFRHVELGFWLLSASLLCGFIFLIIEVIWLFTTDDDDDESDDNDEDNYSDSSGSDLESESSDSTEFGLRFGHRVSRMAQRSLKSLRLKLRVKPTQKATKRQLIPALPSIPLPEPTEFDLSPNLEHTLERPNRTTKQRVSLRAAQRRSRRFRRTLHLVKQLHEGKIYSDFFLRVSDNVQSRARRASRAITSRLSTAIQQTSSKNRIKPQNIRRAGNLHHFPSRYCHNLAANF